MRRIVLFTAMLIITGVNALAQNTGIGTTSPLARLEVKGVGNTSLTNNFILRSLNGDTLLRMRDDGRIGINYNGSSYGRTLNLGGNGLNFYKTDSNFGGAIFPTDTSIVLWSEIDDNNFVIIQPSWGKVGIGTFNPKAKLHIRSGESALTPSSDAITVFESDIDASINLLTPNANSSALYFGNAANPRDGGIVFNSIVPNGLSFKANNATRAVIDNTGNFGIGELTPGARLHVSNGNGGNMFHSEADLIVEDNTQAYIQFSTPNTETSGFLVGNAATSIRSAILFQPDSSIQIRAGGNSTKLIIDKTGNIAVGNFTPSFRLHLNTDSAAKPTSSAWNVASDALLKKDVHAYQGGLDEVLNINPVWFTYNGKGGMPNETGVGVIAQELQQVAPYMVGTWNYKDERGNISPYLSVNNGAMTYMLINAVKEQQSIIASQTEKLDAQQLKVEALEKEMEEMKTLVLQWLSKK